MSVLLLQLCLFAPAPGVMEESSRSGDVRPGKYRITCNNDPDYLLTLRANSTGVLENARIGSVPLTWAWNRRTRILRITMFIADCHVVTIHKLDANLKGKTIHHDWADNPWECLPVELKRTP